MRFNQGIHNILVERGIASENTAMLFMCFYGEIRQTNMATDSFNIYVSPVGVKSLNRFVINWQAGAKLIRHAHEYNGFVTLNASTIKKRHDVFKGNSGLSKQGNSVGRDLRQQVQQLTAKQIDTRKLFGLNIFEIA